MNVIGITGNSGSGKSVVSRIIEECGGFIIDADKIAHEIILKGNTAYKELVDEFGEGILNDDNEINRKALGAIVFNDKEALKTLNEITHRHIVEKIKNDVEMAKNNGSDVIIVDAPLLIETNLHKICDKVWIVYADVEKRVERIMLRDNISREQTEARFKNQTSFEELKKYADLIIDNSNTTYDELKNEVEKKLLEL